MTGLVISFWDDKGNMIAGPLFPGHKLLMGMVAEKRIEEMNVGEMCRGSNRCEYGEKHTFWLRRDK